MSKEEPDIFCCSICLEHFKKPKLLPCQHTFCESCLHAYIQSSAGSYTLFPKWFLCPLCRQTVKSPNINSKPREWASLIPVNNMIISLMQTSEAGAAFNEANESRKCGPCKRDEEISTGSYWFPNCLEFLCENCKKFHRRMKISEMHKMIPVEEMDKEHTKVTEIDEPCPDHVGEILKVFCIGHNTMCCVMCLATHHNECKEIKTLEEMANQMEGDQSGRRFINKLTDIKAKLGEIAKNRQENVEYLNGRSKMVMDEVKVIVDQAKSNLDAFLEDFESKLTSLNEQENEKLSMTKEKIECLLRSFEYGEQILNFLSKNGHPKQVFIEKEKLKMQILNHLNQLKLDSGVDKKVDYFFTADELLIKLKNPMSVQKLGQVETKYETNKKEIMPVIAELCSTCDQDMYKQRLLLSADISEFEAMKLWDVKGNGCISGGLFLSNGTFVCCDCENQTLNAYDKHGNFLFDLKLEYHPLTMDIAFDKEIVVLGHKKPQIYTYDIKQTEFVELQKIKIPYQAKGMTVLENRIIITDGQHVDIMTVFGSKLQSITVRDFSAKDFCFIAADKSSIYYHFQDLLMKISLSRNDVKKVFNVPSKLEKKSKNGIAIDHFGNKYLCVGNSICVLSKDCKKYCLFKTNIQTFAMGFQKNGSRFFVSNSQTSTESIMFEVYEIYLKK